MNEIKAIETVYNGVTFRSRLEARWAAFFHYLNIRWFYEFEGYQTKHGWYVPDFWLPDVYLRDTEMRGVLFEVKPQSYRGYLHPELEEVCGGLRCGGILAKGFDLDTNNGYTSWDELIQIAPPWDNGMMLYVCRCSRVKFCYAVGSQMECVFESCPHLSTGNDYCRNTVEQAYDYAVKYRFY